MNSFCKISLLIGNITRVPTDVIVNSANETLSGRSGSGVDGAIHKAAGPELIEECQKVGHCHTGHAVATKSYRIRHVKAIIHTVGPKILQQPINGKVDIGDEQLLYDCYFNSLKLAISLPLQCQSIAFPCISTGVYGYPKQEAASVAANAVRDWLNMYDNYHKLTQIVFCTYLQEDWEIYRKLLPQYFKNFEELSKSSMFIPNRSVHQENSSPPKATQKTQQPSTSTSNRRWNPFSWFKGISNESDKHSKKLLKSLVKAKEDLDEAVCQLDQLAKLPRENGCMLVDSDSKQILNNTAAAIYDQINTINSRLHSIVSPKRSTDV